ASALAYAAQPAPPILLGSRSSRQQSLSGFWRNRTVRWSSSLTLAALVVLCLTVVLRNDSAAAAMRRMKIAVGQVRSAHRITWWREGVHQQGALRQIDEFWYQ